MVKRKDPSPSRPKLIINQISSSMARSPEKLRVDCISPSFLATDIQV